MSQWRRTTMVDRLAPPRLASRGGLPNFFIQQIPVPENEGDRRMRAELARVIEEVNEGFSPLLTSPGLGITVSEDALEISRSGRYEAP